MYNPEYIKAIQANSTTHTLARVVASILTSDQSMLVSDLDIASEHDLELFRGWNAAAVETNETCVHRLVEEQVRSIAFYTLQSASYETNTM